MRRYRSYLAGEWSAGELCTLSEPESVHLSRVLRASEGLEIDVFNGAGRLGTGVLESVGKKSVTVRLQTCEQQPQTQTFGIAVPLIKSPLLDDALEQAVELGMSLFAPIESARSVVRLDASRQATRHEKWCRLFRERLKQCERTWEPQILPYSPLNSFFEVVPKPYVPVIFSERDREAESIDAVMQKLSAPPVFVIGPEGGWSEEERQLFVEKAVYRIALPLTVLRTETAIVTAAAAAALFRAKNCNSIDH